MKYPIIRNISDDEETIKFYIEVSKETPVQEKTLHLALLKAVRDVKGFEPDKNIHSVWTQDVGS